MEFRKLQIHNAESIVALGVELSPYVPAGTVHDRIIDMFRQNNYHGFGVLLNNELIGFASCWISTRLYFGKQMEIDDFIISGQYQARGIGKEFLCYIEDWAKSQNCDSIVLNTYVTNAGSHKFYFNQGYTILGYHFQKRLNK